jgi:acyl-CoA thioesterase
MPGAGRFALDTAVTPDGPPPLQGRREGRWSTSIHPDWFAPAGPNGGYLAAVVARAMAGAVDDPARRLRSLTLHYLSRTDSGPADVETTVERSGRSLTSVSARMAQDGRTAVLALGAFATDRDVSIDFDDTAMPAVAAPDGCPPMPEPSFPLPIRQRFEQRLGVGGPLFQESPEALTGGWIRLADGEPVDDLALVAMTDAWPPAAFTRVATRMAVPTVDLTVHLRQPIADPGGWFLCVFRTTLSAGGYLEEDGQVWSEDGRLLAHSRQLALAAPMKD